MILKFSKLNFILILNLLLTFNLFGQIDSTEYSNQNFFVKGFSYRLFARAFASKNLNKNPVLVVILHGDAPPPDVYPNYQNIFASKIAEMGQNLIVLTILRPGYTDPNGNHSEGDKGKMNGDNWNRKNSEEIAEVISKLKKRYNAKKLILVGHSGGAAISANIIELHPELANAALLVSCPCGNLKSWRKHMFELTNISVFKDTSKSLSPIENIKEIPTKIPIVLMVGTKDNVAPLKFSKEFQNEALKEGKNVKLIKLENRPHNTFLYSKVYSELIQLIKLTIR